MPPAGVGSIPRARRCRCGVRFLAGGGCPRVGCVAAGEPPATLIVLPVIRSIARSVACSAPSQNDMATPLAPARAVRPMRCT